MRISGIVHLYSPPKGMPSTSLPLPLREALAPLRTTSYRREQGIPHLFVELRQPLECTAQPALTTFVIPSDASLTMCHVLSEGNSFACE